jgi:hypothetical protein
MGVHGDELGGHCLKLCKYGSSPEIFETWVVFQDSRDVGRLPKSSVRQTWVPYFLRSSVGLEQDNPPQRSSFLCRLVYRGRLSCQEDVMINNLRKSSSVRRSSHHHYD